MSVNLLRDNLRVESELRCEEVVSGRVTAWRWLFLEDGSLLEEAPRGTSRYKAHRVFDRAHTVYQQLVAQDGALNRFEARVRTGTVEKEPTYVTLEGREYLVKATGTARVVERIGRPPTLASWSSLDDADPAENVYFVLERVEDKVGVLGLWTRVVCLSFP
jgi:hypothetical protein